MPLTPDVAFGGSDDALRRTWLAAVHESARLGALSLVADSLTPPGPGRNYYHVVVEAAEGERIRVLLNAAVRLVAASRDADVPADGPLEFCEVPVPESYENVGFRVARPEELSSPLTMERLSGLTGPLRDDVRYHRVSVVGDVLFNWFD